MMDQAPDQATLATAEAKRTARPASPFWDSRLEVSAQTRHLALKSGPLLFCERSQDLIALNASASVIWDALAGGATPREAVRGLQSLGLSAGDARTFVADALRSWLRAGYLVPSEVAHALERLDFLERLLVVDSLPVQLRVSSSKMSLTVDEVFGQFAHACVAVDEAPPLRLMVVEHEGLGFILENGACLGGDSLQTVAPRLKAAITQSVTRQATEGFYAHAALLTWRGRGLLILGAPGSGKTTLSVALEGMGFSYEADDVVRITPTAAAVGVPFAPAVKSGAWDLLAPYTTSLDCAETHLRTDGQAVRFKPVAQKPATPSRIDHVLLLTREGPGDRLEAVGAVDALTQILSEGFAESGRLAAETLERLAAALDAATCHRLRRADLGQATRLLLDLVDA
jgi:hypothetical protein